MRPAPDESASYAAEVARLLWPDPWEAPYVTRSRRCDGLSHRDAYLFPSERRPRLMVPADVPGSSSMLQRLGDSRSPLVGPLRRVLERSVRTRAFALTRWPVLRVSARDPRADSIESHLADCFGTEVRVGVLLGTRRVNQKPVLQVFDFRGGLLGYAKIGHNELTAALVRREADALSAVGARVPRSFRVPQVLHHGQWSGLEVLVMSALATNPRHAVTRTARMTAMREVALMSGTTDVQLVESGFWGRLQSTVGRLREQPDGTRLQSALEIVERLHGADRVSLGSWHGDWGHWNMGVGAGDTLQLWDWERYDSGVPIGFDGLHFVAAQGVRRTEREADQQQLAFLQTAPGVLTELGVHPGRHDLTVRLYLLEIAVRYVDALTHGATPALTRRTARVLSLLERLSEDPDPVLSEGPR